MWSSLHQMKTCLYHQSINTLMVMICNNNNTILQLHRDSCIFCCSNKILTVNSNSSVCLSKLEMNIFNIKCKIFLLKCDASKFMLRINFIVIYYLKKTMTKKRIVSHLPWSWFSDMCKRKSTEVVHIFWYTYTRIIKHGRTMNKPARYKMHLNSIAQAWSKTKVSKTTGVIILWKRLTIKKKSLRILSFCKHSGTNYYLTEPTEF